LQFRFREMYRLPRHLARQLINEITIYMERHVREDAIPNDILVSIN
jgi:hypothetical protein